MAEPTVAELNERFGSGGKDLEADVLGELQSIMRLHQLSPQDLFFKWESYCIKLDVEEMRPSFTTIRAFKQDLQDALERSNRAQVHVKTERRIGATPRAVGKSGGGGADVFGMLDGLVPSTPGSTGRPNRASAAKKKQFETPSMSRVKGGHANSSPTSGLENQLNALGALTPSFNDRPNTGEISEILNDHLPAPEPPICPFAASRIKLTAASDLKKLGYRPMAMKLSEASEILDDRIDEFTALVMEHHGLDYSALGSAANQSTTEIVSVGRIASDTPEGKLNAASLVLETSRRAGGGLRIPLNLTRLPSYQLFPGQIVALKGTNASGNEFVVSSVLEIPLLANAASTPEALSLHRQRLRGQGPDAMESDEDGGDPPPLNVMFASGPYTADDNLDFEPLHALCSRAADTYVDALVLNGPFIDADHPLIASGDFDLPDEAAAAMDPDTATMSTVFKYMISPALNRLVAENSNVTVLLVPSTKDVVDKHVSWPQDAFPKKDLGLQKSIRVVGNPMALFMNEAMVGLSSQDVLFELKNEELCEIGPGGRKPNTSSDAYSRLARYLLQQRHYFPLFPPSDRARLPRTGTEDGRPVGAMLDVGYLALGEMVGARPDIMVLPSALPPFARVVDSVVVINPGFLSKRRGAGTYARMTLYPPKTDVDLVEGVSGHRVFDRARVEITRI